MSKYEVVKGLLWIGSEMEDISREIQMHMRRYLEGDSKAMDDIRRLQNRRIELMTPKKWRKK